MSNLRLFLLTLNKYFQAGKITCIREPCYFSKSMTNKVLFISLNILVESIFQNSSKLFFSFPLNNLQLKQNIMKESNVYQLKQ